MKHLAEGSCCSHAGHLSRHLPFFHGVRTAFTLMLMAIWRSEESENGRSWAWSQYAAVLLRLKDKPKSFRLNASSSETWPGGRTTGLLT